MKKYLSMLVGLACAFLFCWGANAAATSETLLIGLFPNLSTRLLLETYQPMRGFLEQQLGRPVALFTAPDFNSFVTRTQKGEYDIIVTAPHFARLAQTEAGYQPVFSYSNNIAGAIVVSKGGPIRSVAQLRGAKIAAPDPIAIISMLGQKVLHDKGLENGKDYTFQWTATHGNVALAVQRGDAAAGIIGLIPLKQLPENISSQLHLLLVTPEVPSQVLLANQRMSVQQVQQFRVAMLAFEQSEAGQKFFKASGLAGLKAIEAQDLANLEPYVQEVKRLLEKTK